jgi:serine/threonine protein kinase/Flp pilus assembly protein TadD
MAQVSESNWIGRTVSHYRVIERLGEGGVGVVYRAWDERLERDVALKVLAGRAADRADMSERIAQEARVLSRLDHPAIATVFDLDHAEGTGFLIMEFVRGATLAERLAQGPVPEPEALAIAVQAADALAAAHEQGVIHRDFKPANVMLTVRGHVKVLDFGLAACLDEAPVSATAPTQHIGLTGTVPYMAPEQLLGKSAEAVDDLFSFGAVFYELVTGRPPFSAPALAALTDAILHRTPPAPRALRPELSAETEAVILRCLEKRPADRYASARALADDLRRVIAGQPPVAAVPRTSRLESVATRDPVAREAYALGRRQWSKRTRESLERAIWHFEAAIDADPGFAPAWSGLADCFNILAPWLPPRLAYRRAKAAAKRAVELDPKLAEAHTSLAFAVFFDEWDWEEAGRMYRHAISLAPEYATAHQWYAEYLTTLERFDEAIVEGRAAEELDALSWAMPTTLINIYYYARRYDEALEYQQRLAVMWPAASKGATLGGTADRARILEQAGRAEEAIVEYRRVRELDDDPRIQAGLACALALAGRTDEARAELATLVSRAPEVHVPPYALAGPLALLGERDQAFAQLERAFETHDRAMVWMRVNPRFDPLRKDPRYVSLLRRMRYPE